MKKSTILLIVGMLILIIGAVLSVLEVRPYSDYVLVVGALVLVVRGALRSRERDKNDN